MELNSVEMINFISNKIKESGFTDSDLGEKAEMDRVSIWEIRNKKITKIKPNTLKSIANALNLKYSIDDNTIDFEFNIDTTQPIGGGKMANSTADKVIDHLMSQNQQANQRLAEMKTVIEDLKEQLHTKDELLLKNSVVMPTLDQSRMQIIVQLDKKNPKFLDVTASYAQYLGYGPFELLGEPYLSVVHEDEFERLVEFEKNPEKAKNENAWKMKHKNGIAVYIKSTAKHITHGVTTVCVIDIEKISEDDYITATTEGYFDPTTRGSA